MSTRQFSGGEFGIYGVGGNSQEGARSSHLSVMQWYYSKNSTQLGPVSQDELRSKLAFGEVAGTDMVWREGLTDWAPANAMPELAVSPSGPPQIPGTPLIGGIPDVEATPYAPPAAATGGMLAYGPSTSGLAIASLICGIMGLVTCLFVPGIPAVICGHMALNRIGDPTRRLAGRGMALAGLIMGYLSIAIFAIMVLFMIIGMAAA